MKYYVATITNTFGDVQQHIIQPTSDGGYCSFPAIDDNPNMVHYFAWIAEGNTAEEWQPEMIEEQ
jgi:hypothetical protein